MQEERRLVREREGMPALTSATARGTSASQATEQLAPALGGLSHELTSVARLNGAGE